MHNKRLMNPNGGKRVMPCGRFLPRKFTYRSMVWPLVDKLLMTTDGQTEGKKGDSRVAQHGAKNWLVNRHLDKSFMDGRADPRTSSVSRSPRRKTQDVRPELGMAVSTRAWRYQFYRVFNLKVGKVKSLHF